MPGEPEERSTIMKGFSTLAGRSLVGLAIAGALALGGPGALAAPTSETVITTDNTQAFPAANPCTGEAGTATITFRDVFHLTDFGNGIYHLTDVEQGTLAFTPDGSTAPTLGGPFEATYTLQSTPPGAQFTLTNPSHVVARASDGSRVVYTALFHITSTPAGAITATFDTLTVQCVSSAP
jgi:hypothetical protein